MKLPIAAIAGLSLIVLTACTVSSSTEGTAPHSATVSESTPLDAGSCAKKVDAGDPDETPYLQCPGVGGYSLIVRSVESGRKSVDLVDSAGLAHPLAYQETITRAMSNLKGAAEWRVATREGKPVPLSLTVHVEARENLDEPEEVTHAYLAIAKITPGGACVTDRILEGTKTPEQLQEIADSAPDRACASTLPPLTDNGPDCENRHADTGGIHEPLP